MYSSVNTERDDSEVLRIQGHLVWVLVALSLLAVAAVSSRIGFAKRIRLESQFNSFTESLWIHAADILNNSVVRAKKVAGPLRYTRAWWLLGVTLVLQFWCADLKSDLLVDDSLVIDSLEDLTRNPEIICYYKPSSQLIKLFEGQDSEYINLRKQLRRYRGIKWENDEKVTEKLARGKAVVIDEDDLNQRLASLIEKLKRNKRKLYVGNTKYGHFYAHMLFNKRLPRNIKENIDYLATRITETRQMEPRNRKRKLEKRGHVIESDNSATPVSFSPMNIVFLSVLFRLWIIGISLATVTFCFEYFGSQRWRIRFGCAIIKICKKIVARLKA